ncbi:MAG: hypothetical protein C4541_12440 [Candidatus Auribacter fodinae]|jgi:hypothetical protein|uniref:CARDB domain-containing protein n=1 Tax=Candidatus Auribacter fodinae TaxID=2093366 RepID=A0A3A4QQN1_9BACT|nr:MAG: hypothetical protein C4541_12440 [Candidatus Auribacter fodinae]
MIHIDFKKISLVAALFGVLSNSAYAVNVEPLKMELSIPAGTTKEVTLNLSNKAPEAVSIEASTSTYRFMLSENSVLPEGKQPADLLASCESWISLAQSSLVVNPGEQQVLNFTISVPQNASGEYAACILIDELSGSAQPPEILDSDNEALGVDLNLEMVYRRSIAIYVFVEGTTSIQGEILGITITDMSTEELVKENFQFKANNLKFLITLHNSGTRHIRAKGNIIIFNNAGEPIDSLQSGITLPVFPGFSERIPVFWPVPEIPEGGQQYTAVVTLDLGDGNIVQSETNFSVNEKGFIVK